MPLQRLLLAVPTFRPAVYIGDPPRIRSISSRYPFMVTAIALLIRDSQPVLKRRAAAVKSVG